jgi:hypothetical protein
LRIPELEQDLAQLIVNGNQACLLDLRGSDLLMPHGTADLNVLLRAIPVFPAHTLPSPGRAPVNAKSATAARVNGCSFSAARYA